MNNGYAICLNEWALDKDIKSELGLLLIISSLTAEKGYCFASNEYFAKLFEIDQVSISRKLKKLEDKKYITITYTKRGSLVVDREIRLTKMLMDGYQKCYSTINKNVKENNTSNNNTSIKKNIKKKYFKNEEVNSLFLEFLDFRKKLKAVNNERAITLLLNKLNEFDDDTKIAMLNKSIENSWKSVFPIKNAKKVVATPEWFNKDLEIDNTFTKEEIDFLNNF